MGKVKELYIEELENMSEEERAQHEHEHIMNDPIEEKPMKDPDIKVIQEKMKEFTDNLDKFLESEANEVADYGDLVQEVLAFGVFYAYLNCANPEEVDWVIRRVKQLSLAERDTFDKKYQNRECD